MAFGFDSSIPLSSSQTPQTSLGDLVNAVNSGQQRQIAQARLGMEQQQHQATLADLLWKQQRQRSLSDLVSQNAGVYGDPMAHAYAQAGFGDEASQAAQAALQRQKEIEAIAEHHLAIKRSQLSAVTTPEQYKAATAGMPPEMRQQWGLPEEYDADAVKRFVASGIDPKEQAELENKRAETAIKAKEVNKGRYHLVPDPVKGGLTKIDELTGASSPVSDGAAPGGPLPLKPQQIVEQFNKFGDAISDNKVRTNLGQGLQSLQRAEGLEALLHMPDLNQATKQQVREAATSLAGLISKGNAAAISQIDELVPESKAAKWAELKQQWTNKPVGAEAKDFLENMLDTARREKAMTVKQMKRIVAGTVPQFADLRGYNAQKFEAMLKARGIDPSMLDPTTGNVVAGSALEKELADSTGQAQGGVHTPEELAAARKWLSDPKNAAHPSRTNVEAVLREAGGG